MGVSFPRFWGLNSDRQVCSEHPYLHSQILSADLLASTSQVGDYRCVPPHLVYIAQGLQPGLGECWASTQPPELYTSPPPGQPSILSSLGVEPWDRRVGLCSTGRSASKLLSTTVHHLTHFNTSVQGSMSPTSSPTLWLYVWTLTFFRIAFLISVIWHLSVRWGELFVDRILSHR